jgi:hypothetical protein
MSIGNLKDEGNKGNNFPFQLKVLQGLQAVANALTGTTAGQSRTPVVVRITGSYTNTVNTYSFSVANVGAGNGTVNGATIKPGEIVNFDASALNNFFAAGSIVINGSGTELLTSFITA